MQLASWCRELLLPHLEKSPASPNLPLPANSPPLKLFLASGQSSHLQPANSCCTHWQVSVHHSNTQSVHMWESHMTMSNTFWRSQSSNATAPTAIMARTLAAFIATMIRGGTNHNVQET